MFVAVSNIWTI